MYRSSTKSVPIDGLPLKQEEPLWPLYLVDSPLETSAMQTLVGRSEHSHNGSLRGSIACTDLIPSEQ